MRAVPPPFAQNHSARADKSFFHRLQGGGDNRLVAGLTEADRSKQKLSSYPSDLNKYRELERIDLSWNFIKVS